MIPTIYTLEEAAAILKLRELGYSNPLRTLRDWARHGKIPHSHLGKRIVFTPEDIKNAITKDYEAANPGGVLLDGEREAPRAANNVEPGASGGNGGGGGEDGAAVEDSK